MTTEAAPADFTLYSRGLVCVSVCTSLPLNVATDRLNAEEPTGIGSKWRLSNDTTFKGGEPMPCPCNTYPATHKHYLFNC